MKTMKDFSKYRSAWMGIAILWVILFHFQFSFNFAPLEYIKCIGYLGVDVFIFASGLGCYYSLAKDSNPGRFIIRRAKRILPTYYMYIIVLCVYWFLTKSKFPTILQFLGNVFNVGWFLNMDNQITWYVDAIWLLYLVAPVLCSLLKNNYSKKRLLTILVILIAFSLSFIGTTQLMFASRIPVFLIGIWFGYLSYLDYEFKFNYKLLMIFLMIAGFIILMFFQVKFQDLLVKYGLCWWPSIIITPGFCFAISFLSDKVFSKILKNGVNKVLTWIGSLSFEFFLSHTLVLTIANRLIENNDIPNTNLLWFIAFLLVFPLGYMLSIIVKGMEYAIKLVALKRRNV